MLFSAGKPVSFFLRAEQGTIDPVSALLRNSLLPDQRRFAKTPDRSLIRLILSGQDPDQRGFSGTVLSCDPDPFAVIDRQGIDKEQFPFPVSLADISCFQYQSAHKKITPSRRGGVERSAHKTKKTFGYCDNHNLQTAANTSPGGTLPGEILLQPNFSRRFSSVAKALPFFTINL